MPSTTCLVDPLPEGVSRPLVEQVELAGLRASQPPEQAEIDGWLLRCLPGKAKRARCVNALQAGERSLDDKLAECARLFREAGLPLYMRITWAMWSRFTRMAHRTGGNTTGWAPATPATL